MLLAYHFFSVAFYSIYVMFAHAQPVAPEAATTQNVSAKQVLAVPGVLQYPALCVKALRVVRPSFPLQDP